jgi:hypothetical protein
MRSRALPGFFIFDPAIVAMFIQMITVWQRSTTWMHWITTQEGLKQHQITEHKGYEGKVKLKHRKVRFIQIPASPCAQVFRYHPNRY